MTRREKLIYLAGIVDGEGHFYRPNVTSGSGRTSRQSRVLVINTSTPLIEWLKANFGGHVSQERTSKLGKKACFRWQVSGERADILAHELAPFLIVKQDQVKRITHHDI